MSARVVNSIIARALVDTAFYAALASEPERTLAAYNLDKNAIGEFLHGNLDRINRFAGFITKVQNNFLWEFFPLSRALLRYYRLESKVFMEFRERHQELRCHALSREVRAATFQSFLLEWAKCRVELVGTGLFEIAKHELLQLRVRIVALEKHSPPSEAIADSADSFWMLRPRKSRLFEAGSYLYDPIYIAEAMSRNEIPRNLKPSPQTIGYLGSQTAAVRLFEISPALAQILSLMNGNRTCGEILQESGIGCDESVKEVFLSLRASGVISFTD
jgi:hypothetical protein